MPEVTDNDRGELREAWERYCDALRQEGLATLAGERVGIDNPQELAEALRAVARMATMALQQRMDFNDPDFPVFLRSLDDRYKYAGPDAYITYLWAPVRGDATYRIRGTNHGREVSLGGLWNRHLEKAPDGSFEIIVSADEQPGNWIALDREVVTGSRIPEDYPMASTDTVGGRTYYWDPDDERIGELTIERIDEKAPLLPQPLLPNRLADQIGSAADLVPKMVAWWLARPEWIRAENTPNVVGTPGTRPPGLSGRTWLPPAASPLNYGTCCWELEPDEALVIESELPEVDYWSFQLYNPFWETPDHQHRQTSISHTHAYLDADGRFRAVISHRDPGVPNWLDAGGNRRGFLFYRWLWPRSPLPTPTATLVKADQVRAHLPAGHPIVDAESRRAQLAKRREWIARRFQR